MTWIDVGESRIGGDRLVQVCRRLGVTAEGGRSANAVLSAWCATT